MKTRSFWLVAVAAFLTGCGSSGDITQADIDRAKSAKFDAAAQAKVAAGMTAGGQAKKAQEAAWAAKKDPAEIARINAERAAMGRPPLGG